MNLILGTAQFGLDYGVTNRDGQINLEQMASILCAAEKHGIELLDTAVMYGDAEQRIGRLLGDVGNFRVMTKLPADAAAHDYESIAHQSLENLRVQDLHTLMLHNGAELLAPGGDKKYEALLKLKRSGVSQRIGVSLYNDDDCYQILSRYPIDIVQAPVNVFDQRFLSDRMQSLFTESGTQLHGRSAFLQGTLLVPPEQLPAYFKPWIHHFENAADFSDKREIDSMGLCLSALKGHAHLQGAVVGCCKPQQLEEIVQAWCSAVPIACRELASCDVDLILPTRWKQ